MKFLVYFVAASFILVGSCAQTRHSVKIENLKSGITIQDSASVVKYANTITSEELTTLVTDLASENFLGREAGELGQRLAADYLVEFYIKNEISSPLENNQYRQSIPVEFFEELILKESENVLAYIEGDEKPEEVVIISAHMDHLGVKDGQIYYGADDNASGTAALMQIAQAFKQAESQGISPKRSILFLHVTAEENGLYGSRYYIKNPVFELKNTLCDLNVDMIGRVDPLHNENKNYIYLIGSDRLSKELHYISEKVNQTYFDIDFDYRLNDENDRNRFYYRSDQYNFAKNGIPVIFYFNGTHADYHMPTDTVDKIDFELLTLRAKLIFATAWQLANQEKRITVDIQ
ncbi:MAG: M20/M25/M40 family metallo-hydrolase [Flavobacteriaceae bacterium]|nr:M20/M25/M40 family metallo-hydrolase [Flavobacteriaceae bacterium]